MLLCIAWRRRPAPWLCHADGGRDERHLPRSARRSRVPGDLARGLVGAPPAGTCGTAGRTDGCLGEPHRHFHDQRHLRECMALWARWRGGCERPGAVALGLWFHDAVFDPHAPQAGSNELNNAVRAARSLVHAGADSDMAQRVHDLVMATQHDAPADLVSGADAQLLLDIDLSILGSPGERFERYDQDVHKEYAWMRGL